MQRISHWNVLCADIILICTKYKRGKTASHLVIVEDEDAGLKTWTTCVAFSGGIKKNTLVFLLSTAATAVSSPVVEHRGQHPYVQRPHDHKAHQH